MILYPILSYCQKLQNLRYVFFMNLLQTCCYSRHVATRSHGGQNAWPPLASPTSLSHPASEAPAVWNFRPSSHSSAIY